MNHVREDGKPRCKISYKLFEEQDVYDPLLDISLFITLVKLKEFLGRIQNCVTVVGKSILTVIFLLRFLSLVTIRTDVALMMTKK